MGESKGDQAKGVCVGTHLCLSLYVKLMDFPVYMSKNICICLCYENDVLVLLVVYYLSNKKGHQRGVDLECRVATTEKGICKECVH